MEHHCHVDEAPCEVVAALMPRFRPPTRKGRKLDIAVATALIVQALPCFYCREVDRAAGQIARLRLGRHERNILLHAPPATSREGAILDPSLKTHSDRETYLRAVRKLARAGLIRTGQRRVAMRTTGIRLDGTTVDRVYSHRTMWLTPFGSEIIECYRRELEGGRPLRWVLHADRARANARRFGTDLVARFAEDFELELTLASANAVGEASHGDGAFVVAGRVLDAARAASRLSRS